MRLDPIEERELILRELGEDLGFFIPRAQLLFHVRNHFGDTLVARMLVERLEEIELAVLLDLHAEVIQLLDGRVAGEEVGGTRSEGNNFQPLERIYRAGNRQKGMDHIGTFLRVAHGVLGDIRLHAAQL